MAHTALTTIIANGETDSGEIGLGDYAFGQLYVPASFTGASVSFKVATALGGTYAALYDTNGLVSLSVSAGRAYDLPQSLFGAVAFKVVSGSSEAADRTLTLLFKTVPRR